MSPFPSGPALSARERAWGRSEDARRARRARLASGSTRERTFASPLQWDESGFPINHSPPSFAERVRRLIAD